MTEMSKVDMAVPQDGVPQNGAVDARNSSPTSMLWGEEMRFIDVLAGDARYTSMTTQLWLVSCSSVHR